MSNHYPECDSFECCGCPRETNCSIKEDVDPQPVVDTPSSSSQGLVNDEFDTRLRNIERMLCDIARAVRGELP